MEQFLLQGLENTRKALGSLFAFLRYIKVSQCTFLSAKAESGSDGREKQDSAFICRDKERGKVFRPEPDKVISRVFPARAEFSGEIGGANPEDLMYIDGKSRQNLKL